MTGVAASGALMDDLLARGIPFTQYVRPDGRAVSVLFVFADTPEQERPAIAHKAAAIIEAGARFECEVLRTGHVSFTITGLPAGCVDECEEQDLAIRVVPNGPEVSQAVKELIMGFDLALLARKEEGGDGRAHAN